MIKNQGKLADKALEEQKKMTTLEKMKAKMTAALDKKAQAAAPVIEPVAPVPVIETKPSIDTSQLVSKL